MSNFKLQLKSFIKRIFLFISLFFKTMRKNKITTSDKQLLLFRIDELHELKYYNGTVITGQILFGTVCLNDRVLYVDKYHCPIFKCTISNIGQMRGNKLTEVSAGEMGQIKISLLIFGYLEYEFEKGCFFMNT